MVDAEVVIPTDARWRLGVYPLEFLPPYLMHTYPEIHRTCSLPSIDRITIGQYNTIDSIDGVSFISGLLQNVWFALGLPLLPPTSLPGGSDGAPEPVSREQLTFVEKGLRNWMQ